MYEEDIQTPTNTDVYHIPISCCDNGVECWGLSNGLQTMVCLPRWQSISFSPCHCQCSKPSWQGTLTIHLALGLNWGGVEIVWGKPCQEDKAEGWLWKGEQAEGRVMDEWLWWSFPSRTSSLKQVFPGVSRSDLGGQRPSRWGGENGGTTSKTRKTPGQHSPVMQHATEGRRGQTAHGGGKI